jgi:hypothetical protein
MQADPFRTITVVEMSSSLGSEQHVLLPPLLMTEARIELTSIGSAVSVSTGALLELAVIELAAIELAVIELAVIELARLLFTALGPSMDRWRSFVLLETASIRIPFLFFFCIIWRVASFVLSFTPPPQKKKKKHCSCPYRGTTFYYPDG